MSDPQEVEATVIEPCDRLDVQHVEVPDVVSNVESVKAWVDGELTVLNDCDNGGPLVCVDNEEPSLTVSTEGCDYEIPIDYCPMCGRKLDND